MIEQEEFSQDNIIGIVKRFRLVGAITVVYLAIGTVFYRIVEDLRWIDSLYFCVVSLLTVGYGDFTPKTDFGKLFTIFYLLCGVGILAAFASILLKRIITIREVRQDNDKK
jgi:voltage-gated potassium channel